MPGSGSDADLVPTRNNSTHSSSESDIKVVVVNEMEVENAQIGYTVDNFNYQVFSETTASIPPLPNAQHYSTFLKSPVIAIRQLPRRIRLLLIRNMKSKQWLTNCSWIRMGMVVLTFLLILILLIILGQEWHALRHEQWLRNHQCVTPLCLHAASQFHSKLNKSVSPCDNFYQYACGEHFYPHHSTVKPDVPAAQGQHAYRASFDRGVTMHFNRERSSSLLRIHRPAIDHLTEINVHAIIMGLRSIYNSPTTKTTSAKFKIAQWFMSCTDKYYRNWVGTQAFIKAAVKSLDGIWLLDRTANNETGVDNENGTMNWPHVMFSNSEIDGSLPLPANWSWMQAIKRMQVDLHVPVFVDFVISQRTGKTPQLYLYPESSAWMGGRYFNYMEEYFTRLLQLLAFEAKIPFSDTEIMKRIHLASKDFELVSSHLYNAVRRSYNKRKGVSLGKLNEQGSAFDWKGLLSAYFSEIDYSFSDDYTVYSRNIRYLKRVSPLLEELQKNYSRPVFNRILNNYMLLNALDSYAWHISYDFAALTNRWYSLMDSNIELDCFLFLHELYSPVLGAIYVENHLHEDAVNHTLDVLEYLRASARDQIEKTHWLDAETKQKIENKIDDIKINYNVPEIMTNDAKLDYAYRNLKTSHVYIENLLSSIQYIRSVYNRILGGVADPNEITWLRQDTNVYDSKIGIDIPSAQLYVPLGALQPPVYHHTLPDTLNFAGLGSMIGSAFAQMLGILGSYKYDGTHQNLWTDRSWELYVKHLECVKFQLGNDTTLHYNVTSWLAEYLTQQVADDAVDVINDATGLSIASRALDRWITQKQKGIENSVLPGEHFHRDKLFYISYAQTFCEKMNERDSFYQLFFGDQTVPREVVVNHLMSEVPEFASIFGCPVGSNMNPKERCSAVL